MVFWVMMPCSRVGVTIVLQDVCHEDAGDTFLGNVSKNFKTTWHHNPEDHNQGFILMMKMIHLSKTVLSTYKTTWCHNLE
jgi:hypothetical protein